MVIRNHLLYKSKRQGGGVSFIKISGVLTWVIKGMRIDTLHYHYYSLLLIKHMVLFVSYNQVNSVLQLLRTFLAHSAW